MGALCKAVAQLVCKSKTCATPVQCNAKYCFLHTSHCTLHALRFALPTCTSHSAYYHLKSCEVFSPHPSSSHLIRFLVISHLSKFYSAFPVWCITDQTFSSLQNFSQLISAVLRPGKLLLSAHRRLTPRSLHKPRPSTTLYYFVLQSLHKARASTTLSYKACTQRVPVLRCTAKLAQSTSQCYFVSQSLHKASRHCNMAALMQPFHWPAARDFTSE